MPQKPPRNKKIFDIEKILKILPHRYPFLLVDRVLEMKSEKSIVALKNVTYNEPFFQGHFPRLRVMPGVLILEAMAQAGGILLYNSIPDPEKALIFLSTLNNTKFRKAVVPGDQLRLEVEIIKIRSRFCSTRGKALVDGELVAETDAAASIVRLEEMNERE